MFQWKKVDSWLWQCESRSISIERCEVFNFQTRLSRSHINESGAIPLPLHDFGKRKTVITHTELVSFLSVLVFDRLQFPKHTLKLPETP